MAKEIEVNGRRYWILSEPEGPAWKAHVLELHDNDCSDDIGIEARAETRGAADAAAERKLRRLLEADQDPQE